MKDGKHSFQELRGKGNNSETAFMNTKSTKNEVKQKIGITKEIKKKIWCGTHTTFSYLPL